MRAVYSPGELTPASCAALADKPARLAVIGNPIAHSRSPQMQQTALDAAGVEATYIRVQAGLEEGAFEACARQLAELGFIGANVTVPFKKQAFALAADADALSRLCGASNTLQFTENGWHAFNTDGPGFARAVEELCGRTLGSMRVLILGACGGAGSALAAQCVLSGCPQLTLANRPRPELAQLAAKLAPHAQGNGLSIRCVSMADTAALSAAVVEAELIVNATSLGLHEGDPLPLDPAWLTPAQVVYDIVPHDTPLRRAAAERGCTASDGLGMLLWQGALAFEHWFGMMPDVGVMRAAVSGVQGARPLPGGGAGSPT